jgi:adenylate cyclase
VPLLPNIQYGTERYPEKMARRLRVLNITAWISTAVAGGFAIEQVTVEQFFDPSPDLWKLAAINALAAPILAAIPLLHRFGALVAPVTFIVIGYVYFFVLIMLLGRGAGLQMYYLVATALAVLVLGAERIFLASVFGAMAVVIIIALQGLVPQDGLLPATTQFVYFVAAMTLSCTVLIIIVFYSLREAARAEADLEREYARSEALLANILPTSIAARLKNKSLIADKYDHAAILFADMAGYTGRASAMTPVDLVSFLNRVFTEFDQLVERHGLEKIKTTGDAYMVVSGVPTPRPDYVEALAQLALDLRDAANDFLDPQGRNAPIRIGIGIGPVAAGVIGTRKFFYDVWGDAVNVASRMESTGVIGKIQVSQDIYERLTGEFLLESRGVIDVKGKGEMQTWYLIGRKGLVGARL